MLGPVRDQPWPHHCPGLLGPVIVEVQLQELWPRRIPGSRDNDGSALLFGFQGVAEAERDSRQDGSGRRPPAPGLEPGREGVVMGGLASSLRKVAVAHCIVHGSTVPPILTWPRAACAPSVPEGSLRENTTAFSEPMLQGASAIGSIAGELPSQYRR